MSSEFVIAGYLRCWADTASLQIDSGAGTGGFCGLYDLTTLFNETVFNQATSFSLASIPVPFFN